MKNLIIIAFLALSCLSAGAQSRNFVPEIVDKYGNVIGNGNSTLGTSYTTCSNSSYGYSTTYNCFYNYDRNCSTKYTVSISGDRVYLNGTSYSLRKLGTITSSGVTFNSYVYGYDERMLCVSTSTISVSGTSCGTVTGYMLMIDGRTYIARRN